MFAISLCEHFKFKIQDLSKRMSVFEKAGNIEDIYNIIDRQINFVTGPAWVLETDYQLFRKYLF
jgi:hypothetical protein